LPHFALPLAACSTVMPRAHDEMNTEAEKRMATAKSTDLMVEWVFRLKNKKSG
jgi:hypothetical protein